MTPEEQEPMSELCKQIQTKKDPQAFDQLVRKLNDLIEIKHERIHPEHKIKQEKFQNRPLPDPGTRQRLKTPCAFSRQDYTPYRKHQ